MSRLLAVVLVCALLPQVVRAQDTGAPTPPDDAPVAAPPLVSAPDEAEPETPTPGALTEAPARSARATDVPAVPRLILESLGGGAGMVVGGLAGLLVGAVTSENCTFEGGGCGNVVVMGLGGMVLGSTLGTYGAGRLMEARGGFLSTFLGSAVGAGAGVLLLSSQSADTLGVVALLTLPIVGGVMGYELSRTLEPPEPSRLSLTGPHVPMAPAFGTTPRGGFVGGVVGRF